MLISRKCTQDKRVVTDFRHLNVRIAKNNLAYPLLKDIFLVSGNSKCEVLSVLDLKDAFHSLRLSENPKKVTAAYFLTLVVHLIYTKECLWDWIYCYIMPCHLQDHFRTKYDNRIYLIANTLQALNSPLYFHYLLASYKEMTCIWSKTKRK